MAFRILYDPASDISTAVISSSSDGSSHADDNAVKASVGKTWRTDSDTAEWIKWDLVATTNKVDCVTIQAHNLTKDATVTFEGNASDSWGSPPVDETIVGWNYQTNAENTGKAASLDSDGNVIDRITHYFTQATLRYWRVTIDDPTNPDAYIQIGRVMFGEYYDTTRDITADLRVETLDPSEGVKSPGTVQAITEKAAYRRIRTSFAFVTQAATDKWGAIFKRIGNNDPALICWDTSRASIDSAYAYMITPLNLAHQFSSFYDIAAIVWEEKTR